MKPFITMLIFLVMLGCKNTVPDGEILVTGILKKQMMTTYQYGTHTLTTEGGFFALTSKKVNLDNYLNEKVTLVAEEIEGYPVDGGPIYLRVLKVKQ